jgi:hypothetical protein
MKQQSRLLSSVTLLALIILSACNAPSAETTPTEAVDAVYTAAAETIIAQAAKATSTPTPTIPAPATNTLAPTVTPTSGASSTPVSATATAPAQNFCDNARFISDVTYPDNSVLAPGQVFEKTWAMLNTGTCTWTEGYTIVFSSGDVMSGTTRAIGQAVAPQAQVNVTVKLTAPFTPGTYTGIWRLANGKGDPFGQIVSVVIKVAAGATTTVTPTVGSGTVTATSTSAPIISTATPTPTNPPPANTATPTQAAPTATETPAPTLEPTVTETPTS